GQGRASGLPQPRPGLGRARDREGPAAHRSPAHARGAAGNARHAPRQHRPHRPTDRRPVLTDGGDWRTNGLSEYAKPLITSARFKASASFPRAWPAFPGARSMANKKIEDVEGIGPAIGAKLKAVGVKDTDGLLERSKTPAG